MFSDDKKKKGISISPLNFVQGPDGSLNVTDVHTEEDFARALKLFELNSKRIQSTQRIARNAPDSLENGSRLPNLTEEEKNARNAEKCNCWSISAQLNPPNPKNQFRKWLSFTKDSGSQKTQKR